ncbi:MAG TPA: tetratricopeptide repeat protein [Rhodanobacteraceae bacterium]
MGAYFSAFAAVAALALLVAGCAQWPARQGAAQAAATRQPLAQLELPAAGAAGQVSAWRIAAEFALQNNDPKTAATDYAHAARLSADPGVASRAAQIALIAKDAPLATQMLARWQSLGADAHALAGGRGQLALLEGNATTAEREFGVLVGSGALDDWKTLAADLLTADDRALAGRVLVAVAQPARLPASEAMWVALSQLALHLHQQAFAGTLAAGAVRRFDGVESIRWAASLRIDADDRAGALALYRQGVAAHPRSTELRLGYATLLAHQGATHAALAVLARGPQTPETWSARVAYAARAKDTTALRSLYTELQRAPAAAQADNAFLLGQLAETLHQDQAALKWYAAVDPDSDNSLEAQVRSAVLLNKLGQTAQAHAVAAQLQHDYVGEPDGLRAAYELDAQLYSARGDYAQAIAAYNRGLTALPHDSVLTYDRGIAEATAGDTDAALKDFRAVLARDPDDVEAMNALGFTLADANRDLPEATQLLRKALAAKPDTAEILDSWGWLQFRLGHLDRAETYLRRAWAQQQDPDIGVHLGEVLWRLGQHRQARELFGTVRKLDPDNATLKRVEGTWRP